MLNKDMMKKRPAAEHPQPPSLSELSYSSPSHPSPLLSSVDVVLKEFEKKKQKTEEDGEDTDDFYMLPQCLTAKQHTLKHELVSWKTSCTVLIM